MATTAAALELPADTWPAITEFLAGADLFSLARANRWTWRCFSHDDFWLDRLAPDDAASIVQQRNATATDSSEPTALRMYMRAFSIQFKGLPFGGSSQGSAVDLDQFHRTFVAQRMAFSFDVWFSLLDSSSSNSSESTLTYTGGVLLGGQSSPFGSPQWPHYHQQFALVSSDRKLYCSVLTNKPKIASDLEINRWYHLALTYDGMVQHVYLDGALVSSLHGPLHREWYQMWHFQVGSGCVTAGELNFPRPSHCGWYPFHGLVDDFRIWQTVLSSDDVQTLARGGAGLPHHSTLYAMKRDLALQPAVNAKHVGCSRPHERVVVSLRGVARPFAIAAADAASTRSARSDRSRWQQSRRTSGRRGGGR